MEKITGIASKLGLSEEDIYQYGNYKAKILKASDKNRGNLILVTAMNPTPYGEGKTTVSIGLLDAFCKLGYNAVATLREPSMGPVFGMKGGATGGGLAKVEPEEEINLHFTGDFHAITSANNLLCAAIDNHIFQGNKLGIEQVLFHRCLDVNDRALRNVILHNREEKFNITAASEIMSIFTLATTHKDLKEKLGNIMIGLTKDQRPIFAKELQIENALYTLLKNSFYPNLVQTLEENPVIIHGGPFANIAHGCNSIIATKKALSLADYVITEAGFGADLGAEKFFNIKCRKGEIIPQCAVVVATMKALKYHGGCAKELITEENLKLVKEGLPNLERHIENIQKFGVTPIVCLNKFHTDTEEEINIVKEYCISNNILFSVVNSFSTGGEGAIDLANTIINQKIMSNFKPLYDENNSIKQKIEIVAREIYRAKDVNYSNEALKMLDRIYKLNLSHLPICIAKTPYSFTDNEKLLGAPNDFIITVKDLQIYHGAGFIVVLLNNILTMPGLNKSPNYLNF